MRVSSHFGVYWAGLVFLATLASMDAAPAPGEDLGLNHRPFPALHLPAPARGAGILQALGNRLPEVAGFYGTDVEELRAVARRDPHLHADRSGRLFYVCEGLAQEAAEEELAGQGAPFPDQQTFVLHSRPSSTRIIYLDFDGHTTAGTSWNTKYNGGDDFVTPPFDIDGEASGFSALELERIQFIWQRVAEDFAMLDVDVTTEDPGEDGLRKSSPVDAFYGVRVCIGGSSHDWYGSNAGGIAYIGSFSWSSDTPCFVFPAQLASGQEKAVAEAASHETGHTLGLNHDGITGGSAYYGGHGSGATSWAPIMGNGYSKIVTQWSQGEYANANNPEDDLAKMMNYGVSYRPDDHGDEAGAATRLLPGPTVVASGTIERSSDVDVFALETGEGIVTIRVAMESRSPNLDVLVELYDGGGDLVASTNPPSLGATLQAGVGSGTYYLALDGVGTGDPNTGYTDYGSLGDYTLSVVLSNAGLDPPTAVASATPVSGRAPLEVQFSGSDSADADGSVASFLWNFGDGVISAEADPRHVYTVGGTFIASLVVTDNDGLRATNSIGIAVLVPPGQPLGLRISTAR